MKQHTPGPWVVGAHPEEDVYQVLAPEQHQFETVIAAEVHEGANARLMSAAPDLLSACEALAAVADAAWTCSACWGPLICEIHARQYGAAMDPLRTALAKAREEAPPC